LEVYYAAEVWRRKASKMLGVEFYTSRNTQSVNKLGKRNNRLPHLTHSLFTPSIPPTWWRVKTIKDVIVVTASRAFKPLIPVTSLITDVISCIHTHFL